MCVLPHVVTLLQLKQIIIENSYFFPPFCDESSLFANQVEEKFETHFWKWGPRIMILALLCRLFCNNKDDFITDKNINGYPVIIFMCSAYEQSLTFLPVQSTSTVGLQLESGERLVKEFPTSSSLWDVLSYWDSNQDR